MKGEHLVEAFISDSTHSYISYVYLTIFFKAIVRDRNELTVFHGRSPAIYSEGSSLTAGCAPVGIDRQESTNKPYSLTKRLSNFNLATGFASQVAMQSRLGHPFLQQPVAVED